MKILAFLGNSLQCQLPKYKVKGALSLLTLWKLGFSFNQNIFGIAIFVEVKRSVIPIGKRLLIHFDFDSTQELPLNQ